MRPRFVVTSVNFLEHGSGLVDSAPRFSLPGQKTLVDQDLQIAAGYLARRIG